MTEEQIALAKRAVACKGWRFMGGMLLADAIGKQRIYDDVAGEPYWSTDGWLPDLTDPATMGCLLALVREAVRSDDRLWGGRVEVHQDSRRLFVVVCPEHDPNEFLYHRWIASGESEAEALVAALEAAP
jgi:hypothetical protein